MQDSMVTSDAVFLFSYRVVGILLTHPAAKSLQSCPTLCDPTDSSPLGSSVPTRKTILKKLKITNIDKDVEK